MLKHLVAWEFGQAWGMRRWLISALQYLGPQPEDLDPRDWNHLRALSPHLAADWLWAEMLAGAPAGGSSTWPGHRLNVGAGFQGQVAQGSQGKPFSL